MVDVTITPDVVEAHIASGDLMHTGSCPRCKKSAVSSHLCFDRGQCVFAHEWAKANASMLRALVQGGPKNIEDAP